jgi:Lysine-specific metallo-endopeptidase
VLSDTGEKSRGLRLLRRWFGDEDSTDDQLRAFGKGNLLSGLKKMAPKMSAGHLIITDFVPIRHSADAGDQGFAAANAFVWQDKRDVVYVEKAFFKHDASSVFQNDERHWARIMVHEMSHREAKTDDKRYGWAGIKPKKASFASATAMVNADSWALFIANAAGAMTRTDVRRALAGTGP